jgi:soluble lytic murein transglycosylase-like protein
MSLPTVAQGITFAKPTDYASLAKQASQKWGVPANVILGLIDVESGGDPLAVSGAGARGATQFMPGTAAGYGVTFGSTLDAVRSQVDGAAHYLHDLGYADNPRKALASYNAGPGNWQAGLAYAGNVLTAAKKYAGLGDTTAPISGDMPHTTTAGDDTQTTASGTLHTLVWIVLAGGGAAMVVLGVSRATGLRQRAAA